MHLLREDQHEPLRMRQNFGPLPNGGRPALRYRETVPKPERATKALWKVTDTLFRQMAAKIMAGFSEREVADDFGVSRSTVQRAKRMYIR